MTVSFRRPSLRLYLLISLLMFSFCMSCVAATVKRGAAPNRLAVIDSIVQDAIRDGQTPGAVVLRGHNDKVIYRKAFGSRALEPRREAMTLDTIFDLASLTKVVATTTAVMQLSEQGKVRMNDAVERYVPEFGQNGKDDITVWQLLTHYSGLAPDLDLQTPWQSKETAYRMAFEEKPEQPPTATAVRGFGWDIDSPFSSNRGELLPVGSYGHTGWTGTSLWIDPTTRTYIILLTNAVHPRGKGSVVALRTKLATAVAAALPLSASEKEKLRWQSITGYNEAQAGARHLPVRNGAVKAGIDVLEEHNFEFIVGPPGSNGTKKKIGLLTNQTGVDSQGRRTIDVLAHAPGISLDAIFSPEHGVTGAVDTTEIGDSRDAATGVPVYNVYGATDAARRPSVDVLKTLDAVVVDIQDAGVRFYTYETTLGYFMEAAAKAGIHIMVLDRPNPITGYFVPGAVADTGRESFVDYFPVPVRHGMTMGELAKMFNGERGINARLEVIAMEGWLRGDWYDSTGLIWISPSPNLRSLTEATLYPGVALVEGTNVSVGRGTDTPFELLGAPWIKARALAQYLNERNLSGVRFIPTSFTPTSSNYAGQLCAGVNIILLDRNTLDAPELGIELAAALHKLYPQDFKMERMIEILANQGVYDALAQGRDPRRIAQDWQDRLDKFQQLRQKYLIYK